MALWTGLLPREEVTLPEAPQPAQAENEDFQDLFKEALARSSQGRNTAGYWLSRQLHAAGVPQEEAKGFLLRFQQEMPDTDSRGRRDPYTTQQALASLHSAYRAPVRTKHVGRANTPSLERVKTVLPRLSTEERLHLGRLIAGAAYRLGSAAMAQNTLYELGFDKGLADWAEWQAQQGVSLPGWPAVERFLKERKS